MWKFAIHQRSRSTHANNTIDFPSVGITIQACISAHYPLSSSP